MRPHLWPAVAGTATVCVAIAGLFPVTDDPGSRRLSAAAKPAQPPGAAAPGSPGSSASAVPAKSATSAPGALSPAGVQALLDAHCIACHGERNPKGGVRLAGLALPLAGTDAEIARRRKSWTRVLEQIESQAMPPEGKPPLPAGLRDGAVAAIRAALDDADRIAASRRDPGPAVVRRLNRTQYNRSLRDLLGTDFDVAGAVGIPEEGVIAGYDTQAEALTLPETLLEKYFAGAEMVLEKVIGPVGRPQTARPRRPAPKAGKPADKGAPPPATPAAPATPWEHLFTSHPADGIPPAEAARRLLADLARRAYRRPVTDAEVARLTKIWQLASATPGPDGKPPAFEDAVRLAAKAVLVSPHFLLRIEPLAANPPPGAPVPGSHAMPPAKPAAKSALPSAGSEVPSEPVDDHALAARLSYFLWSSIPDRTLRDLADAGRLRDPAELERQVIRMLADPRADALTEGFAAQWLQLRRLEDARPTQEFFPTFTPRLRTAMHDEVARFVDTIRTEDRPVGELLDADWTFVNADLAKHYGLPEAKGNEMRRVPLPRGGPRGGLLGMAGVLTLTSHTFRTSPTLRGKWVLEVIFGKPPPPPPPDAGMIDETKAKGKEARSFRELLAQHATRPACAGCHARIDPLGFGLESFDAIGRWRTEAGGRPVDASGRLPGGETFNGPAELKRIVLARKDEFRRNLVAQLLAYALGRELQPHDTTAVDGVLARMGRSRDRFSSLVAGVATSFPFTHRRTSAGE